MDKILLAKDTIDSNDFERLIAWLKTEPRLTKGEQTVYYEKQYAESAHRKYAVFVNSGSSANLLALYALISDNRLKNKKVVCPALSWITTVSPVIQFGLDLILCDIEMQNLAASPKELEAIFIKEQPSCLILVSVLGLTPYLYQIVELCKKYDVLLIMDNCESQGSVCMNKSIESFGLLSSCSSYFGHNTSTIEGGMVTTDDEELYNTLKMLRSHGWDRDIDDGRKDLFRKKWSINKFNALYAFYKTGFNLRATDVQAFIGIGQLKKLPDIVKARHANFVLYNQLIKNPFWKPTTTQSPDTTIANLGYPVIHPEREKIVSELQKNNVEVRPLISGSMGIQPFFVEKYGKKEFENAAIVDKFGFYLPNHPKLTPTEIEFICKIINNE